MRSKPSVGSFNYKAAPLTAPEGETRTVTFVASDETTDRMGDVIRAAGWDLKHYKTNPVLLWAHNSRELPIGKVSDIAIKGTQLLATAEFVTEDMNPQAEKVLRMLRGGFLNAVSVGFRPTKAPNDIKDKDTGQWTGFEFTAQDLYELSVVPVPANPAALAVSRSYVGDADAFFESLRTQEEGASAAHLLARYERLIELTRLRVPQERSRQ